MPCALCGSDAHTRSGCPWAKNAFDAAFERAWRIAYSAMGVPRDAALMIFGNGWVLGARHAAAGQSIDVEGVAVPMGDDWRPTANLPLDGVSPPG